MMGRSARGQDGGQETVIKLIQVDDDCLPSRNTDRARKSFSMIRDPFADQQWLLEGSSTQIILDVGAHIGQTCERYHGLFSDAQIYSFEPFLETFEQLRLNVSKLGNVIPIPYAIGKAAGMRE